MKVKTMLNKIIAFFLMIVTLLNYSNIVVIAEDFVNISVVTSVKALNGVTTTKTGDILTAAINAYNNNPNATSVAKVRYYIDQTTKATDYAKVIPGDKGKITFNADIGGRATTIDAEWGNDGEKDYLEFELPAGAAVSANIDLVVEAGYDKEVSADIYGVYSVSDESGEFKPFTEKNDEEKITLTWEGGIGWDKFQKKSNTNSLAFFNGEFDNNLVYEFDLGNSSADNNIGYIYTDEIDFSDTLTLPEGLTIPDNAVIDGNTIKVGEDVIFKVDIENYNVNLSKTANTISLNIKMENPNKTDITFNPVKTLKTELDLNKLNIGSVENKTKVTNNATVSAKSVNIDGTTNVDTYEATATKDVEITTLDKFNFTKRISRITDEVGHVRDSNEIVHDRDLVYYTLSIQNPTGKDKTINFEDIIPDGLELSSTKRPSVSVPGVSGLSISSTQNSDGTTTLTIPEFTLPAGKNATISYVAKVDVSGETSEKVMTNVAKVDDEHIAEVTVTTESTGIQINKEVIRRTVKLANGSEVTIWRDLESGSIRYSGNISALDLRNQADLEKALYEYNAGDIIEYLVTVENNTYDVDRGIINDSHPFMGSSEFPMSINVNNMEGFAYYAYGYDTGLRTTTTCSTEYNVSSYSNYGIKGMTASYNNNKFQYSDLVDNSVNSSKTNGTNGFSFSFSSYEGIPAQSVYYQTIVLEVPGDSTQDLSSDVNSGYNLLTGGNTIAHLNSSSAHLNTKLSYSPSSGPSTIAPVIVNHTVAPLLYVNTGTLSTRIVSDKDNIKDGELKTTYVNYAPDMEKKEYDMHNFAYNTQSTIVNYVYIYNESETEMDLSRNNIYIDLPEGFKWLGFVKDAKVDTTGIPTMYFNDINDNNPNNVTYENTVDVSNYSMTYSNSSNDIISPYLFLENNGNTISSKTRPITNTVTNSMTLSASISGERSIRVAPTSSNSKLAPYTGMILYYATAVSDIYDVSMTTPSTFTAYVKNTNGSAQAPQASIHVQAAETADIVRSHRTSYSNNGTVNSALTEKDSNYSKDVSYNTNTKFNNTTYDRVWSHVSLTPYFETNSGDELYEIDKVNQSGTIINKPVTFEMYNSKNEKMEFVKDRQYYRPVEDADKELRKKQDQENTLAEGDRIQIVSELNFKGTAYFIGIGSDDYTLVEKVAPEGYKALTAPISFNVKSEGILKKDIVNIADEEVLEGKLTINKISSKDSSLITTSSAKFEIYDSSTASDPLLFKLEENGEYRYSSDVSIQGLVSELVTTDGKIDLVGLPYKKLYIKEKEAPYGYTIGSTTATTVDIKRENEKASVNIKNTLITATINVSKTDKDTGSNITSSKATFQVINKETQLPVKFNAGRNNQYTYNEKGTVTEIETNPTTGTFTLLSMIVGDYEIKEITPPVGYKITNEKTELSITDATTQDIKVENEKQSVTLRVSKKWKPEDTGTLRALKNVEFELYEISGNSASKIAEGTTDENGIVDISDTLDFTKSYFLYEKVPEGYLAGNTDLETVMKNDVDGKIYTDISEGTAGYTAISVIKINLPEKMSEFISENGGYTYVSDVLNIRIPKSSARSGAISYETVDNYKTAELKGIEKEKAYSFYYSQQDHSNGLYNYVHVLSDDDIVTYTLTIQNVSYYDFENLVIINKLPATNDTGVANTSEQRKSEYDISNVDNTFKILVGGKEIDSSNYTIEYSAEEQYTEEDFAGTSVWSESSDGAKSFRIVFADNFTLGADEVLEVVFDGKVKDSEMGQTAWNNFAYRYVSNDSVNTMQTVGTEFISEPPKVGVMVIQEPEIEKSVDVATDEIFYFDVIDLETNKVVGTAEVKAGETGKLQLKRTVNGETVGYLVPGKKYRVQEKISSKYNFDKLSSTTAGEHSDTQKCNTKNFEFTYNTEEAVKVKFENKKKIGKVIVHHYLKGSGEEFGKAAVRIPTADQKGVNEDITTSNYIDEGYTTSASTDIFSAFKLVSTSENTSGSYIDGTINVYYYYDYDDFKYTIKHHYENKETRKFDLDDTLTKDKDAQRYGTKVQAEESDKVVKTGYRFKESNPVELTITENADENIINLYYELEDYNYTVNYYYDGELKETNSNLEAEYKDIIKTFEDKPNGYVFEKLDYNENGTQVTKENKEDLALVITEDENKNIINIYYRTQYEITKEVYEHEEKLKDGTVEKVKGGTIEFEDGSDDEKVFKNDDGTKNLKVTPDDGYVIVNIKVETDDNPIELTKEEIDELLDNDGTLTLTPEDLGLKNLQDDKNIVVEFRKKSDVIVKYLSAKEVDEEGNSLVLIDEDRIDGYEGLDFNTERKFKEHYQASDKGITDENDNDITDYDQVDLDENNNAKGKMYADELVIIYWYERIPAGILVRHIEITEEDIENGLTLESGEELDSEIIKGFVSLEETTNRNIYSEENDEIKNEKYKKYKKYISVDGPASDDEDLVILGKDDNSKTVIYKQAENGEEYVVEVRYYYEKQYNITTEVRTHKEDSEDDEEDQIDVKGGSISGEDNDIFEIVNRKGSNSEEIKIEPEYGYRVKEIVINDEPADLDEFEEGDDHIITIPSGYFDKVDEDINVVVEFEKIPAKVIIKYVDIDTGEEIVEESIEGLVKDSYDTERKDIENYIPAGEEPENKSGEMIEEDTIVTYYYKKQFKITTEVLETEELVHKKIELPKDSNQETTSIKVKGGTISGEEEEPYEIVERGNSSEKEIILKPNKGYKIVSVTKNGKPIEIKDEAGFTLDQFDDMQEDIHIVVKYERIKSNLIVKYLIEGTEETIEDDEKITGNIFEKYTTEPKEIEGYELVMVPENKEGALTDEDIIVKYYYRKIVVPEIKDESKQNNPVTGDTVLYNLEILIGLIIMLGIIRFLKED